MKTHDSKSQGQDTAANIYVCTFKPIELAAAIS